MMWVIMWIYGVVNNVNYWLQSTLEHEKQRDVVRYINANGFLMELKRQHKRLNRHELKTLRGQALSGDVDGAMKGLRAILDRR